MSRERILLPQPLLCAPQIRRLLGHAGARPRLLCHLRHLWAPTGRRRPELPQQHPGPVAVPGRAAEAADGVPPAGRRGGAARRSVLHRGAAGQAAAAGAGGGQGCGCTKQPPCQPCPRSVRVVWDGGGEGEGGHGRPYLGCRCAWGKKPVDGCRNRPAPPLPKNCWHREGTACGCCSTSSSVAMGSSASQPQPTCPRTPHTAKAHPPTRPPAPPVQIQTASIFLVGCPACNHNFKHFYCLLTCSPDQATFTNVTAVQAAFDNNATAVKEVGSPHADGGSVQFVGGSVLSVLCHCCTASGEVAMFGMVHCTGGSDATAPLYCVRVGALLYWCYTGLGAAGRGRGGGGAHGGARFSPRPDLACGKGKRGRGLEGQRERRAGVSLEGRGHHAGGE